MSKLMSLKVQQWMAVEAVEIPFRQKGITTIGGPNGSGKSSVLKCLKTILRGKRELPEVPVRLGQKVAIGELTFGDDKRVMLAHLEVTPDGGYKLELTNKDRTAAYSKPASTLAELTSELAFNPSKILDALLEKSDAEQAAFFFRMAGLDFTEIDARRKRVYDDRTLRGRDVAGRQGQIDAMPAYLDAPGEEVSVAALVKEMQAANEKNRANEQARDHVEAMAEGIQAIAGKIANAEKQIKAWKDQLAMLQEEKGEKLTMMEQYRKTADACHDVDTGTIQAKIGEAEQTNARVRANAAKADMQARFAEQKAEYDDLTKQIEALDAEKAATLAAAKFPVDGLTFPATGGVLYKGLPLAQDSASGQTLRAIEIAAALHPGLEFVALDDSEKIGPERRQIIEDWAQAHDYQVIRLTSVPGGESIVIEDGKIKGAVPVEEPQTVEAK